MKTLVARCIPRRDREHGAILVLTSAALVVLMAAAALTVDIGHQTSKKRYVEFVADQAGSDAVPGLGQGMNTMETVKELAVSSVVRNHFGIESARGTSFTDAATGQVMSAGLADASPPADQ